MTFGSLSRCVAVFSSAAVILGALEASPVHAKRKGNKGKKAAACASFKPGDLGKDAETRVVTHKATAKNPVEVVLDTDFGLGFSSPNPDGNEGGLSALTSRVFHNVQVDSKKATTGLFVRIEFPMTSDYDLYLRSPDGAALAWEWSFNNLNEVGPADGLDSSRGGRAEYGASQIDGYRAHDCDGFTVDVWSAMTAGGEVR